jgi:hypothetical protein
MAAVTSFAALAITGSGGPALASTPATGASVPFSSAAQRQLALLGDAAPGAAGTLGPATATASSNLPRELVVPDVLAVIPTGIPGADVARIRKLPGVRGVLTVSGGAIRIGGQPANVIGVTPQQFRSWTPPSAAGDQSLWQALAHGGFITSNAAKTRLGLTAGQSFAVTAARQSQLPFGGSANLGIPGVDAVVSSAVAGRLGLVKDLGVLINAPADNFTSLVSKVRAVTGAASQVVSLQPTTSTTPGQLPVATSVPTGRPTTYLALYQASAARYCPGLSWTVLAAIGEVESGNGANLGPSSAGALGPMQFLPSTWQRWGITGFGDTGAPNIMNPFDAVPSAAEYLCAAGGAKGGSSLYQAIFAYNHADWYVSEVLAIAREYAQSGG